MGKNWAASLPHHSFFCIYIKELIAKGLVVELAPSMHKVLGGLGGKGSNPGVRRIFLLFSKKLSKY